MYGIETTQENRFHILDMNDGGIMVLLGFPGTDLGRGDYSRVLVSH